MLFLLFLVNLIILPSFAYNSYVLEPGETVHHTEDKPSFEIYCYSGKPKYVIYLWQTISLQLEIANSNYVLYDAPTANQVYSEYAEDRSSWSINPFMWKQKEMKLDPFNHSCVGIHSSEKYAVRLNLISVDYWKISRLIIGVLLFLSASRLSRNGLFYYICGISFGIAASFLVLLYFICKLFPKSPMMYGVAVGGWSVSIYLLKVLWDNLRVIFVNYQTYVVYYALITGFVSFIVCYRMGPVSNKRTLNLIQWALQLAALILIYFSTQFREAGMGQAILIMLVHNFPRQWVDKSKSYWNRKFPPKAKIITNDEYYRQGVRETNKALDDLRKYCSSPNCNQWKTVLKLSDSKRFASFMEGVSHLSDQEILEYEASLSENEFTDDEEQEITEDES